MKSSDSLKIVEYDVFISVMPISRQIDSSVDSTMFMVTKSRCLVISPGPATPDQAGICLELIDKASGAIPIFGVCLGLQAMGQSFGGKVVRAGHLMHGKVSKVHHGGKGVFAGIPQDFTATRYHSLIVERDTLPDCFEITAETDGMIMGLQHKTKNVHGVQFHPESIASEHGHKILRNFLDRARARGWPT